ncbi:hypothetical protein F2P56_032233 [Juglans regia]|uniref:Uncharacterized protein n=1 Tax=Juglans regia TaxID=51240 RepID=A0A833TTL6_JUGRE|nr:hypothetical protein F2P56_032233 [Juglans regia]
MVETRRSSSSSKRALSSPPPTTAKQSKGKNSKAVCAKQAKRLSNGGGEAIVIAKDQQRTQEFVYGAHPDQRRPSPGYRLFPSHRRHALANPGTTSAIAYSSLTPSSPLLSLSTPLPE